MQYRAGDMVTFGVGVAPSLTARSMQGSWPFWAGSDRLMAEEFFRGGFSSGIWATGDLLPRLTYTLTLNNNISELGVSQANDTRDLLYGAQLRWQPTTGEFGPRNGFGDLEHHEKLATQFGVSGSKSRESRYAPDDQPPANTQIDLSDGTNPFAFGSLADSTLVRTLNYMELSIDAGAKYKGFAFQTEYFFRTLDHFQSTRPLPLTSIYDHGFQAEASYMIAPKSVMAYVVGGYVWDQFRRFPWELGGGLTYYPSQSRSWRLNAHLLHVRKSPASSFFGYYLGGFTGTIFSPGMDILF
jgi:hypothetical protein